jgi:hypothetical protein
MSDELTSTKESIMKVLLEIRTERFMSNKGLSIGLQAPSTRGLAASPSTACTGLSRPANEKCTKHRDDLTNAKLILSILLANLPPLSGTINFDSVPQEFDYAVIATYLPKWVRVVHADQDKIATLKFSDLNLGDWKAYNMLALHKYLTRTKGKNSNIIPHPWTQNLT